MDNPNEPLPLLPDPLESAPAALPAASTPTSTPAPASTPTTSPKPRRNYLRLGLISGGVVVVLLLVLFGSRLADLLNLRGTKAGQTVELNGNNFISGDWYDSAGNTAFTTSPDGKLILVPPVNP